MTSTSFIFGGVTGRNDLVGYYTIAEKAVRGIRYLVSPVTQALFPYLSKRFAGEKKQDSIIVLKKLLLYLTPFLMVCMIGILVFTNKIVHILTGNENLRTIIDMRIISVIILVGTYNNVLGVLGMLNLGMEKQFRNNVIVSGIFNLVFCLIASHFLLDMGASISIVATETLLMFLLIIKMKKIFRNA
jgi:PST family polysaccharide transporter